MQLHSSKAWCKSKPHNPTGGAKSTRAQGGVLYSTYTPANMHIGNPVQRCSPYVQETIALGGCLEHSHPTLDPKQATAS